MPRYFKSSNLLQWISQLAGKEIAVARCKQMWTFERCKARSNSKQGFVIVLIVGEVNADALKMIYYLAGWPDVNAVIYS